LSPFIALGIDFEVFYTAYWVLEFGRCFLFKEITGVLEILLLFFLVCLDWFHVSDIER